MSETERFNTRDLTYSTWHRTKSLSRYVGQRAAYECSTIDIDWCEYCRRCGDPLALIEMKQGTRPKDAKVMTRLAARANVAAYSMSYETDDHGEISLFHLRHLTPPDTRTFTFTASEWAMWLVGLRERHGCVTGLRETG